MANRRLEGFAFEVAQELGYFPEGADSDERAYRSALDRRKFEVAEELGIPLRRGDNGDISSRDAGRIGGRLGGRIGGQMVRRLIQLAEQELARGAANE